MAVFSKHWQAEEGEEKTKMFKAVLKLPSSMWQP